MYVTLKENPFRHVTFQEETGLPIHNWDHLNYVVCFQLEKSISQYCDLQTLNFLDIGFRRYDKDFAYGNLDLSR